MGSIFNAKVAIVTSGAFGFGRATVIAFANAGAAVVIADWVEDNETLNHILSHGGKGGQPRWQDETILSPPEARCPAIS